MIIIHYIVPRIINRDFKDEEGIKIEAGAIWLPLFLDKIWRSAYYKAKNKQDCFAAGPLCRFENMTDASARMLAAYQYLK